MVIIIGWSNFISFIFITKSVSYDMRDSDSVWTSASIYVFMLSSPEVLLVGSFLFFLSVIHFSAAVVTKQSHSSVHYSGPFTAIWSNPFNKSFLSLFLRSVLMIFTFEAPLSGQVLESCIVGTNSTTFVKKGHMLCFIMSLKHHSKGVRPSDGLTGILLFFWAIWNFIKFHSAFISARVQHFERNCWWIIWTESSPYELKLPLSLSGLWQGLKILRAAKIGTSGKRLSTFSTNAET